MKAESETAPNFLPSVKPSFRWFVAGLLAVLYLLLVGAAIVGIFRTPLSHPAFLPSIALLLLLLAPLESLLLAPLYGLSGRFHYYSPLLLATEGSESRIELHVGTLFDYVMYFRWRDRGAPASRKAIHELLRGLLVMIDSIPESSDDKAREVVAASYFFSDSTLAKLGFNLRPVSRFTVVNLMTASLSVMLRLSFVRGRWTWPRFGRTREAYTSLESLRLRRPAIKALLHRLGAQSE